MRFLLTLVLLAFTSGPAAADQCDTTTVQAEMNRCAQLSFKKEDSELNSVYAELKNGYAKFEFAKTALVKSQRAWLAYRDANCALEDAGLAGASVQPMVRFQCLARLTSERVSYLRTRLNCQEGDLSCIDITDAAN